MVVFNRKISAEERAYFYKAGATRQNLLIINKLGREIEANTPIDARLGHLDKGKHSFLFVNPGKSKKTLGVLVDTGYLFEVVRGSVWHGTSEAALEEGIIGIFEPGAVIKDWTYKRRQGCYYWHFDGKEWKRLDEAGAIEAGIVDVDIEEV